ncbi:MAG: phosphodiester glycosidase family protein [Chloroflexota bacterium]|nr:phosphodiester glycosidase family protein [Chloroflexota bacterium]
MNKKFVVIAFTIILVLATLALLVIFTIEPAKPLAETRGSITIQATSIPSPTNRSEPTAIASSTPMATATATLPLPTATPRPTPTPTPTPKPLFKSFFTFEPDDKVQQLSPGVIQVQRTAKGPMKINIVLFDLTAKEFQMRVVSNEDWLSGVARTSTLAKANKALVAVNGDEFSSIGLPQGMMVSDGQLFMAPKHRATFGWTKDRQPFIGFFTQDWTWPSEVISANGAKRSLQLLNTTCENDWMCLYNEFYGNLPLRYNEYRVLLDANYKVIDIKDEAALKILPGQMVLVGKGLSRTWLKENIKLGDNLRLNLVTNPDYRKFDQVVSGGPIVLDKGKFVQDCLCNLRDCSQTVIPIEYQGPLCEEFTTEWKYAHYLTVRMPRIGIGYNKDKTILIVTATDGYQPGYSIGMTSHEVANLLLEFGAYSGMELDGGGSATMWVGDKLVSRPSDGGGSVERYVANALTFYWNEPRTPPGKGALP